MGDTIALSVATDHFYFKAAEEMAMVSANFPTRSAAPCSIAARCNVQDRRITNAHPD